jgi:hypothetical protein
MVMVAAMMIERRGALNDRYIDDNIHLHDIGNENLLGGGALFLRRILAATYPPLLLTIICNYLTLIQ